MTRKVMLSVDDELLTSFDEEVRRRHTSRSQLVQEGMRRMLPHPNRERIEERIAEIRAWADEHGGSFESAESIRAERDWLDRRDRTR